MGLIAGVGDFGLTELQKVTILAKDIAITKANEILEAGPLFKARENHTGVQPISTVTGLKEALDAKFPFIVSTTFAAIPAQSGANYKLILVLADETNGNVPTIYFYDGAGLQWLPTSKL